MRWNAQELAESREVREILEKGNFVTVLNLLEKELQRSAIALVEDGLVACQGIDLLITGSKGLFSSIALAENYHLPLLQAYLVPVASTKVFPILASPQTLPNLGGAFNFLSHRFFSTVDVAGISTSIQPRQNKKYLACIPLHSFNLFIPTTQKICPYYMDSVHR